MAAQKYTGTEAQKRSSTEYNRRHDAIMLRPSKEQGAEIRQAAADAGQSVTAYIMQAVREYMDK